MFDGEERKMFDIHVESMKSIERTFRELKDCVCKMDKGLKAIEENIETINETLTAINSTVQQLVPPPLTAKSATLFLEAN
jgi:archaellum component FlaC